MTTSAIVEIVHPSNPGWVTVRVTDGQLDAGNELTCVETGAKYRVEGFALGGSWEAAAKGYTMVRLGTVLKTGPVELGLEVGMHLVGVASGS